MNYIIHILIVIIILIFYIINILLKKHNKNSKKDIDILLVGSSIIKRWKIENYYNKSVKIINLGINGIFSEKVISKNYINMMSIYNPKNIIYYCGGNDIRKEHDLLIDIKNIQFFLLNLKNIYKNNINVIFIAIFKNPKNILYNKNINIVNKSIKIFINDYNKYNNIHLNFLDINKYIFDSKYFMEDNIHLNKDGYEILNKKTFDLIYLN
jgi:lysophospholipase L1-like esterase